MGDDVMGADGRYQYSAIPGRAHGRWPGNRKLAVWVGIGVEDYRFGGERTENLLADVPAPDLVNTAWRDYGNRVGAFRILDRLDSLDILPTVLLNTMVYDTAPDVITAARRHNAEIVGHGVSNSDTLAGRSRSNERAYLTLVADRIAREEGSQPGGWSSPWLTHTENTVDLLAEAGYRYLLDLRLDDQPVWLTTQSTPLLAIPYPLELNDSTTMIGRSTSAGDFADMIVDEFDELMDNACDQPLVMGIVLHSFITGTPFRLRAVARALQHLASRREDVWFTQPGEIYKAFATEVGADAGQPALGNHLASVGPANGEIRRALP